MNYWYNLNLLDSCSPIMEWLILFHDYSLMINLLIILMIFYIMIKIFMNKLINLNINNQFIEIIWTIFPGVILVMLAFPSLKILYLTDETFKPLMTLKSIGHQWYWSYEFSDFYLNSYFESFLNSENDLNSFRLLDVDIRLVVPMNTQIRMLTSSDDVIHSFSVPSVGIKSDSVPGRINQMNFIITRPGLYFGQCSEICGANHSFMPIVMEVTNLKNFFSWCKLNL